MFANCPRQEEEFAIGDGVLLDASTLPSLGSTSLGSII